MRAIDVAYHETLGDGVAAPIIIRLWVREKIAMPHFYFLNQSQLPQMASSSGCRDGAPFK